MDIIGNVLYCAFICGAVVMIAVVLKDGINVTIKHDHTYNMPAQPERTMTQASDPMADTQKAIEDVANKLHAIFLDDSQIVKDEEKK
jgi:Holliday junction resolvase RusA-like endonuclease